MGLIAVPDGVGVLRDVSAVEFVGLFSLDGLHVGDGGEQAAVFNLDLGVLGHEVFGDPVQHLGHGLVVDHQAAFFFSGSHNALPVGITLLGVQPGRCQRHGTEGTECAHGTAAVYRIAFVVIGHRRLLVK